MPGRKPTSGGKADLRHRAEAQARREGPPGDDLADLAPEALRKIIFDLRVHQIELEIQKEELQRTQEELGAAKARYFDLYDLAPVGYCSLGEGSVILEANLTLAALVGRPRASLSRRTLSRFILPEDLEAFQRHLQEVAASRTARKAELRMVRKDGSVFWALLEATPAPENALGVTAYVVVSDISERRTADRALAEREAQFRNYIDNAPIGVFLTDDTGRYLHVNPAASRITGFTREELLGMTISDLLSPGGQEPGLLAFRQVMETGYSSSDLEFQRKNAALGTMTVDAVRLAPDRLLGFVSDITERQNLQRAQSALFEISETAQTAPSLAILLEAIHRIVARLLPVRNFYVALREDTGRITFPYFVAARRTVPAAHTPGFTFADLVFQAGETRLLTRDAMEAIVFAGTVLPQDPLPLSWLGVPLLGEEGPFGVLAVYSYEDDVQYQARDGALLRFVTTQIAASIQRKRGEVDRRRLRSQLQQAQKMESLGRLAGGIAHDMNNVLAAILAMASVQLPTHEEGSPAHLAFDTIAEAATRGGKVVKGLLHFARQAPAESKDLDLNALIRQVIALLDRPLLSKVALELDLAPGQLPVHGDAAALTNAFMNLLVNAVDALPKGGRLVLRSRLAEGGWAVAEVEDHGTGMPQAVLDRALDPFFTTKEVGTGTGLGLSMVYTTVKAHQGELEIQSSPGQGTRVILRFPLTLAPADASYPAQRLPPPPPHGTLSVLIVDDDDLVRRSTQMMVAALGHTAMMAASGEEALEVLAQGFQPEVVILDMNMPGMGGAGLLPHLKARCPVTRVLLATGRADQEALDLVHAHPGVILLPKPFDLEELERHLA